MSLDPERVRRVVRDALEEDIGSRDITTEATVPEHLRARAVLVAKQELVVAGLDVAAAVFKALDPEVVWQPEGREGDRFYPGTVIGAVAGRAAALLTAERVALNFLGRLSGVATMTKRYVDAVAGTGVAILDTRKTTPGLRALEKHAVACGGGRNHRFGLDDAVLVKDNHLRAAGSISKAVESVRATTDLPIEVECDTLEQVSEALDSGVDAILLDNMSLDELRSAVLFIGGRVRLEASGGITLENVRAVAETGVDQISVGALTHSARSLDVSLELQ